MSEDEDEDSRTPVEGNGEADLAGGAQKVVSALERLKTNAYLPRGGDSRAAGSERTHEDYVGGVQGDDVDEGAEGGAELLTSMCSFNDPNFGDLEASAHQGALFDRSTHSTVTVRTRQKTKTLPLGVGGNGESQKAQAEANAALERTVAELVEVVAAYDAFVQRIVRTEREVRENERRVLTAQRDAAQRDVVTLQRTAADLHTRFETARALLDRARAIETAWQSKVPPLLAKYASLKRTAEEQLEKAYREADAYRARSETELTELRSRLRRVEMERDSLRQECARRANETAELHAICDDLVAKLNDSAS